MNGNLAEDRSKLWTYADYLTWDDDQRWELIDGRAYLMALPSLDHQRINKRLLRYMDLYFEGKPCEVFMPIDVRLFPQADDNDYTIVQPDISVVCNPDQLDKNNCLGAPTLVVEILSPSTASHDFVRKMNSYRNAGVREYWIVDPDSKTVMVNILDNGRYYNTAYGDADAIPVHVLDGCTINLSDVFAE